MTCIQLEKVTDWDWQDPTPEYTHTQTHCFIPVIQWRPCWSTVLKCETSAAVNHLNTDDVRRCLPSVIGRELLQTKLSFYTETLLLLALSNSERQQTSIQQVEKEFSTSNTCCRRKEQKPWSKNIQNQERHSIWLYGYLRDFNLLDCSIDYSCFSVGIFSVFIDGLIRSFNSSF